MSRTPTKAELAAAYGTVIPDLVGPDLRVLLVGINPSLWSGWSGLHFGRPTNRLWVTLYDAGLTDRKLHPEQTDALLAAGPSVPSVPSVPSITSTRPCSAATSVSSVKKPAITGTRSASGGTR